MPYFWLGAEAESAMLEYQIEEARKAAEAMKRLEEEVPE